MKIYASLVSLLTLFFWCHLQNSMVLTSTFSTEGAECWTTDGNLLAMTLLRSLESSHSLDTVGNNETQLRMRRAHCCGGSAFSRNLAVMRTTKTEQCLLLQRSVSTVHVPSKTIKRNCACGVRILLVGVRCVGALQMWTRKREECCCLYSRSHSSSLYIHAICFVWCTFIAEDGVQLIMTDLVPLKKHVPIADYTMALTSVLALTAQNRMSLSFNASKSITCEWMCGCGFVAHGS